jgi:hypothetical protein
VDLSAVSFSAADDGWVVANIYDRLMDTRESRVFRWDGSGWDQVFRICHRSLTDVATAGPSDVWFATGGSELLHYDGADWTWQPILGEERPSGPGARVNAITLTADGGWGFGRGFARYDGRLWRTVPSDGNQWWYVYDLAAVSTRDHWAIERFSEYERNYMVDDRVEGWRVYYGRDSGELAVAHEGPIDLAGIAAVVDDDGLLHVWAVGGASTVLHYQATAADVPLPEPTATPRLPAPDLHPTPTPRSSLRPDDVRDLILSRHDPDGERGLQVTAIELTTAGEVLGRLMDYQNGEYTELGTSWRSSGDDACYSWRPVWMVVVEGDVWCGRYSRGAQGTHAVMVLDGTTGQEELTLCLAAIRSRLHLPFAVGGGYTWVNPTPAPRDVTPRPAVDAEGPCPTMTPYPREPGIGYP